MVQMLDKTHTFVAREEAVPLAERAPLEEQRIAASLPVSEIFLSLQGETSTVGLPTVFVRLWGCNLKCPGWPCDSLNSVLTETAAWKQGYDLGHAGDTSQRVAEEDPRSELMRGYVAGLYDLRGGLDPVNPRSDLDRVWFWGTDLPRGCFSAATRAIEAWAFKCEEETADNHTVLSVQGSVQAFMDVFRPTKIDYEWTTWKRDWHGDRMTVDQIMVEAIRVGKRYTPAFGNSNGAGYCTITGGEPTLHGAAFEELALSLSQYFSVNVETNGSRPLNLSLPVRYTVDLKTDSSKESGQMLEFQYELLRDTDEVKIVAADVEDLERAADRLRGIASALEAKVLVSPVYGSNERAIAEWLLEHRPRWRFQMQLHKHLWGNRSWGI